MLAMERYIVDKLPLLFSQGNIFDHAEEELAHLFTESEAITAERTRQRDKLVVI